MSDARSPILDAAILVDSLRNAVTYAATAGLLKEGSVLDVLRDADAASAAGRAPDAGALTLALNRVAVDIAPMTLADLNFGRNPLSPENQRRSRLQQLVLTVFALLVLVHIGYFMHSLRLEQAVVQTLDAIQQQRPQQKMVALRKMAQYDKPLGAPSALHDQYHERVAELVGLNNRLVSAYVAAVQAAGTPLFPADLLLRRIGDAWTAQPPAAAAPPATPEPVDAESVPAAAQGICEEAGGSFRLPDEALRYPQWMQLVLADTLSDFCFQLKVFSPGGGGALIHQSLSQLSEVPSIQEKVALRADWFLPFFFGLLGATLSMMRALGNIRLPAMSVFSILMRISLGGVAGIAIGWFSVGAGGGPINGVISLPFVLAFVVGYGIDALFAVLDRLNRLIGEVAGTARPA